MRALIAGLLVAVAAAGCSNAFHPAVVGPLVTIERHGGLCSESECRALVEIKSDGSVFRQVPRVEAIGRLSAEDLEQLQLAIANTDFAVIRARPFTGTCPIAFDGQETIYTFTTPAASARLASCEVAIDLGQQPFVTLNRALENAAVTSHW